MAFCPAILPALRVAAVSLAGCAAVVSPASLSAMTNSTRCDGGYAKKMTALGTTHQLCRDGQSQPLLNNAELRAIYQGLAPGASVEITDKFLRSADPLPYLDIYGPGANRGADQPNPPRAVFLMRPSTSALAGPLLFVAPAQITHSLSPSTSGGLADDVWRVVQGPYAPTVYGMTAEGAGFVAFPQEIDSTTFTETARTELAEKISKELLE